MAITGGALWFSILQNRESERRYFENDSISRTEQRRIIRKDSIQIEQLNQTLNLQISENNRSKYLDSINLALRYKEMQELAKSLKHQSENIRLNKLSNQSNVGATVNVLLTSSNSTAYSKDMKLLYGTFVLKNTGRASAKVIGIDYTVVSDAYFVHKEKDQIYRHRGTNKYNRELKDIEYLESRNFEVTLMNVQYSGYEKKLIKLFDDHLKNYKVNDKELDNYKKIREYGDITIIYRILYKDIYGIHETYGVNKFILQFGQLWSPFIKVYVEKSDLMPLKDFILKEGFDFGPVYDSVD